jgi:hypothetical protein
MKVIVWGCFWDTRRTSLYIIDRDFESQKHGYSTESYLKVLDTEVGLYYTIIGPEYTFIQDNTSIHTVYKVRD